MLKETEDHMQEVMEENIAEFQSFIMRDDLPHPVKAYLLFSLSRFFNIRS